MLLWYLTLPTAIAAFQWPSFWFGGAKSVDQVVFEQVVEPDNVFTVAIVGAGAAGSSAAYWLSLAKERLAQEIAIEVFEQSDYIGGRSTVVFPYDDTSFTPKELGAAIFVDSNKNMIRAANTFGLEIRRLDGKKEDVGIWDGTQFVARIGDDSLFGKPWNNLKLLWRYGFSAPSVTRGFAKQFAKKFEAVYSTVKTWSSVEELADAIDISATATQTTAEYLSANGINDKFSYEIVEAATRVHFAQNLDEIHGVQGLLSMATDGAAAIEGGSYQVFRGFLEASGAKTHLKTSVTSLRKTDNGHWVVDASSGGNKFSKKFNAVIIAAPLHDAHITLPDTAFEVKHVPYVQAHVTYLTTTSPSANPAYFGLPEGTRIPSMVLTTAQGSRAGGPKPEFFGLSFHDRIADDRDEWAVRILSEEALSDEWLSRVFVDVGWVYRKKWEAYPKLSPTDHYPPLKLDDGLYYVNGFERLRSSLETQTVASRGIVDLLLKDAFEDGLCPKEFKSDPPEGADFVWGWDC